MMPSARRWPRVPHLRERLVQERVPVPHADVDGQGDALLRERASERVGLAARQLVERRAPADQLVVVRHLLEALRRNAPARRDDLEERADVLGSLGSSERDQQHRVDAGHRDGQLVHDVDERDDVVHRRLLVDAVAEIEDVAGPPGHRVEDLPAPRGGSRPCSTGARRGRGCPAPPRRGRGAPTSGPISTRQSRPITSPPASFISGKQRRRCRCRSG